MPRTWFPIAKIFLAGSIEMGKAADWQSATITQLSDYHIRIFNPRVEKWDAKLKQNVSELAFVKQVTWEQKKLVQSDIVLVHFVGDTLAPISLHELGQLAKAGKKVIVSCPKEFWRLGNIQVTCILDNIPLYELLEDAINHIKVLLEYEMA
jgi:hypothetical protein